MSQVAHDSLTLTWDDPQDARITGHRVLRGTDADSLSTIEADSGGASTEYTDATVAAGTTYFYAVLALSADGDGAQSGTVNATTPAAPPPAAPTGLAVARVGHSVLTLTWDHPQDERITGYGILRGSSADSLSTITADTGSASTEYADDTVAAETTYFYAVLALSPDGDGPQSSAITATTTAGPDPKKQPQRVVARQSTVTLVSNLSQTANQNATYSRDHGQAFTTGSNSTGYTVTSVTIVSTDPNADAIPLQLCEVDGSVHPTTACTDLTPPSSYPEGNLTYTAPTSPALTLDADTTYMLVFKAPPSPTELQVAATSSDDQDSTSLAGFSIANVFQWYNNSNTWMIASGGRAIRITITGRANTVPEVTVSFPPYVYTVREGGTVSVPVNLSADPERTVIIPIMASGLHGATTGDYSLPTSVTFNAGGIFRTITLSAKDDGENDSDGESVLLSFGTLPSRVSPGAIISLTIPIIDNNRLNANNPPTASDGTVTQREDWRYTFKATDFDYSDAENDAFDHLKITELPAQGGGVLTLNNVPITQNDLPMTIDSTRNRTGRLNYVPPADGNGTGFASFKFKVNDGRDDSTDVYTMTINVTPVNDPAYGRPYIRGVSQVGYTLTAKTFFAIGDRDGVPATFDYQWKRYAADGTTFEANIGVNSPTYTLAESDRGRKVSIEVSFTDNEGTREGPLESFNLPRLPTHTVGEANFHSNMGLLGDTSIDFTADHGLPFTTGTNPSGYTVSRVLITSEDTQGDDITVQICEVDSSGNPTTTCTALTAPNSFARGLLSFNAPTNPPLVVQGNLTKYMVVIKSPGGDSVRIDATWGDGFDYAARDSGWSMINRNQIKISNAWRDVSGKRIRVAILGTINPSAG